MYHAVKGTGVFRHSLLTRIINVQTPDSSHDAQHEHQHQPLSVSFAEILQTG